MAPIDLRLRNLETSELLIASFESEDDAATWLRERPHMMEVLSLIAENSDPAMHQMLREAARPLDPDEAEVVRRMDVADAKARIAREIEHAATLALHPMRRSSATAGEGLRFVKPPVVTWRTEPEVMPRLLPPTGGVALSASTVGMAVLGALLQI